MQSGPHIRGLENEGGSSLVELMISMSVLTLILGAALALHLQGLQIYQDVAASDWATFDAATAVRRLEEDIQQCFRVTGRHTDQIAIAMPLLVWDSENETSVPVQPMTPGETVAYYLSDATGEPSAGGPYLWRAVRAVGGQTFARDPRPLADNIDKLQFTYDMLPSPRDSSAAAVGLLIKAWCKEGGVTKLRSHSAHITLRNAKYGPVTRETGLESPSE